MLHRVRMFRIRVLRRFGIGVFAGIDGIDSCMMGILDMQDMATLLNMVLATEELVDFFEADSSSLWDEEPDEKAKKDVHGEEEVEGFAVRLISFLLLSSCLTSSRIGSRKDGCRINTHKLWLARKIGKNCCMIEFATFCICEHMPTAWARTFMENISAVQIHTVAPQEGL